MNTIEGIVTKRTEDRFLCPKCMKNDNFEYVVKHDKEGGTYYLGERCPRCQVHYNDFKEISYRRAQEYMVSDGK